MRPTAASLLADAWRLWRADWSALTGIVGLFLFVADLARRLILMPHLQRALDAADKAHALASFQVQAQVSLQVQSAWTTANLPWLLLASLLTHFGTFVVFAFYLDRGRPDVRGAIVRAAVWMLPYIIAMIVVSLVSTVGLLLLVIGYFYAMGRLSLVGPVIVAEQNGNPLSAIGRSLTLTRGNGLTLTALVIVVVCTGVVVQLPFAMIDDWMVLHAPDPVGRVIVGVAGAALATAAALAMALVQVAAYRRLSAP